VTQGLNPGDKIITQGLAQVKPGQPVKPVAANTPQRVVPPTKEQMEKQAQGKSGAGR
jgi:membrane fusion protein (multidrug efflux system)